MRRDLREMTCGVRSLDQPNVTAPPRRCSIARHGYVENALGAGADLPHDATRERARGDGWAGEQERGEGEHWRGRESAQTGRAASWHGSWRSQNSGRSHGRLQVAPMRVMRS
eukprot:2462163-Pyramimonas_sp.AAC.1